MGRGGLPGAETCYNLGVNAATRPRIGVTTSTLERAPEGSPQQSSATHAAYTRAVFEAGGMPFLLPNLPAEVAEEALAPLDGLLLSGGGDIDARHFGQEAHPALGLVDPLRDAFELALFRAAVARDLPVLAICRGVQVMAVASDGDLWQDIPTEAPGSLAHRQTAARGEATHQVRVAPGSLLARVLRCGDADVPVNSFHHQAPRGHGALLVVSATSEDGLIEALEAPGARFVLGVQWHPEEMTVSYPVHCRLFEALVAAAHASMCMG